MTYMFDGKQYIAVAAGSDHHRAGDPGLADGPSLGD